MFKQVKTKTKAGSNPKIRLAMKILLQMMGSKKQSKKIKIPKELVRYWKDEGFEA